MDPMGEITVTVGPAMLSDSVGLATGEEPPRLLYKVAISDGDRSGAYYWTAPELRALRDALCVAVSDDVSEPEELAPEVA